MLRLIAIRLLQLPLILAVIFVVTFTLAWIIPGNPLESNDRRPPREVQEAMLRQYNLHSPWAFARSYLANLAQGNLGDSLTTPNRNVNETIGHHLPVSVALGLAALIFALIVGVLVGVIGAVRPGSMLDLGSLTVALIGISLPAFVTGSVLLILFAGALNWAPIGDWVWPGFNVWTAPWWNAFGRMLGKMVLPAITLGVGPAAYIARLVRLGLADVLSADYIRTARAKGLPPRKVLFKHALKVAFLPVLSFLGPAAAAVMTGSFVVEKVFTIAGLGQPFVEAVLNKDQTMILGIVLVYSTMLVVFNLAVDVVYAWIDPRIELTG